MNEDDSRHRPSASQKVADPVSGPGPEFGSLLQTRIYTATRHFLTAAIMFVILIVVAVAVANSTRRPGEPFPWVIVVVGIGFGIALGALLCLLGMRLSGSALEWYEQGMRFTPRSGRGWSFLFADVRELKKTTLRGQLAKVTFVLADGRSHTVGVHAPEDAPLLAGVLARFEQSR